MFEIIMLLGFLLAATSQMLPDKAQDKDDESEASPSRLSMKRKERVHVFIDKKRQESTRNYLHAGLR